MSKIEKTFIPDEVVTEILEKAREDKDYKNMLFNNPKEALGQFGVAMPDVAGEDYFGKIYSMYDRGEFYTWFYKSILNELKCESEGMAPGLCQTATEHEDVNWDFEVTKYDCK